MSALMFLLAMQCFLPIFDAGAAFLGLSVVNTDSQARDFTVTTFPAGGGSSGSGQLSLPANGQRARLLGEIVNPAPSRGYIRVVSPTDNCPVFLAAGTEDTLSGTDAANVLSTSILLPHIEIKTGFFELGATNTSILIANPGSGSASVITEFVDLSGRTRTTTSRQIGAGSSVEFRASDDLEKVIPANGMGGITFQGYVRLTSNVPVAAWQQVETPLSRSVLRGTAIAELKSTPLAVMPHFVFGGDYGTFINLVNPDSKALNLELSAHDNRGNTIGETIQIVLQPGEARRSSVGEFFRVVIPAIFPAPIITGYVRIREQGARDFVIVGNVEIFGSFQGGRNSIMLSPISTAASSQWYVPFSASTGDLFTGYAVVAQNVFLTVQTDVTIEVFGSDGTLVSTTSASLPPGNRIASLIPDNPGTGYIRVRSNLPVFVLGSLGARDLRYLEHVPAVQ